MVLGVFLVSPKPPYAGFSGEETPRDGGFCWVQKVKGQNPTLYQNNNKTHPTRSPQGHPFCMTSPSPPAPPCEQSYKKVGGDNKTFFKKKNYLKLSMSPGLSITGEMFWGGERRDCLYRSGFWVLRCRVLPSIFHIPVIPVCFGEYPKVLENPISVSQINWGGDLEAGGGLFCPFGLAMGGVPRAKENI